MRLGGTKLAGWVYLFLLNPVMGTHKIWGVGLHLPAHIALLATR
jgi:hypothetical protein